jgi:hypothetical protein
MITQFSFLDVNSSFIASGVKTLTSISTDNSICFIRPSHNGIYQRYESPLRANFHLINLAYDFEKLGLNILPISCQNLLQSFENISNDFGLSVKNPIIQVSSKKSRPNVTNGIIGIAWLQEYLTTKFLLEAPEYKNITLPFFFDNRNLIYRHIHNPHILDFTLDHQAWFLSSCLEYTFNNGAYYPPSIIEDIYRFLCSNVRFTNNFIFIHNCFSRSLLSPKKTLLSARYDARRDQAKHVKEVGYHLYTLLPLAKIYYLIKSQPQSLGSTPLEKIIDTAIKAIPIIHQSFLTTDNPFFTYNHFYQDFLAIYFWLYRANYPNFKRYPFLQAILEESINSYQADLSRSCDYTLSLLRSYHITRPLTVKQLS